jgi:hypothetical protein
MTRTLLVVTLALLAVAPSVRSQVPVLPLVQSTHLERVGHFDVPGTGWDYGGTAVAFNPASNSLFLVGWTDTYATAEIDIPETLGGVTTIRQALRDPLEGKRGLIGPRDSRIGGQLVWNDRLLVSVYAYYDAEYSQQRTHFARPIDLSTTGQVAGPVRVGDDRAAGYYGGYMAPVPQDWRAAFGAPAVTGLCCIPILSRTSYGPALFAFDPVAMKATGELLWYDGGRPLAPYGAKGKHPLFNGSTSVYGVVIPAGTSSVLFFGRTGLGDYCYGDGKECNDPDHAAKGEHAYPYAPYVWAYDARDLAAVKRGRKAPQSVRPYATWEAPVGANGGVAYDERTGRIYIAQIGGSGMNPRIHVFRVAVK